MAAAATSPTSPMRATPGGALVTPVPTLREGDASDLSPDTPPPDRPMEGSDFSDMASHHNKKLAAAYRYRSTFKSEWSERWPYVVAAEGDAYMFYCQICRKRVSCAHQGVRDVTRHLESDRHRKMAADLANTQQRMSSPNLAAGDLHPETPPNEESYDDSGLTASDNLAPLSPLAMIKQERSLIETIKPKSESPQSPGDGSVILPNDLSMMRRHLAASTSPPSPYAPPLSVVGSTSTLSSSTAVVSASNPALKDVQCPICLKVFSRKFSLEMHFLIHQGLKPYQCPHCGRSFRQKGTLMRHKAIHSQTPSYRCGLCDKSYRQKNVFLHHLRNRHKVSTDVLDRRRCSAKSGESGSDPSLPLSPTQYPSSLPQPPALLHPPQSPDSSQTPTRELAGQNLTPSQVSPTSSTNSNHSSGNVSLPPHIGAPFALTPILMRMAATGSLSPNIGNSDQPNPFLLSTMLNTFSSVAATPFSNSMSNSSQPWRCPLCSFESAASDVDACRRHLLHHAQEGAASLATSANFEASPPKLPPTTTTSAQVPMFRPPSIYQPPVSKSAATPVNMSQRMSMCNGQGNNTHGSGRLGSPPGNNNLGTLASHSFRRSSSRDILTPDTSRMPFPYAQSEALSLAKAPHLPSTMPPVSAGDVTFTCIPCQVDFYNEDEFECHVKTHVQSVLGSETSPVHGASSVGLVAQDLSQKRDRKPVLNSSLAPQPNLPQRHPIRLPLSEKSKHYGVAENQDNHHQRRCSEQGLDQGKSERRTLMCVVCDKLFGSKKLLRYHSQMHLSVRGTFPCARCKQMFQRKYDLLRHTRRFHMPRYKCDKCQRSFCYSRLYQRHSRCCTGQPTPLSERSVPQESTTPNGSSVFLDKDLLLPLVDIQSASKTLGGCLVGVIPLLSQNADKPNQQIGVPVITPSALPLSNGLLQMFAKVAS